MDAGDFQIYGESDEPQQQTICCNSVSVFLAGIGLAGHSADFADDHDNPESACHADTKHDHNNFAGPAGGPEPEHRNHSHRYEEQTSSQERNPDDGHYNNDAEPPGLANAL